MKKNEHETLREKFWDWWNCTSFGELMLTLVGGTGLFILFCLLLTLLAAGFLSLFKEKNLPADEPGEGVGRNPAIVRYLSPSEAEEIGTAVLLDTYTEGDGTAPEWYRPDEPMSAEWFASCQQVAECNSGNGFASFGDFSASFQQVKDLGCPDYSIEPEVVPDWIRAVPMDRWFQEYLHGLCEAEGVPYLLAVAVIEAESGYDPGAVSDCGDYGLMQINRVCHEWLGAECGVTDWLDPWQNARAGVHLLGEYWRDFGYESGTLMAYNMGREAAEALFARGIYATDYSDRVIGIRGRLEAENG